MRHFLSAFILLRSDKSRLRRILAVCLKQEKDTTLRFRGTRSFIVFIVGSIIFLTFPSASKAADFYVSPESNLSSAVSDLNPGDTLILRDGIYYSAMNVRVSGTVSRPITIKAEHDGRAIVDGQMNRIPFEVGTPNVPSSSQYLIIEGIRFQNSSGSTVAIYGSYITLRRVSAYTSGEGMSIFLK